MTGEIEMDIKLEDFEKEAILNLFNEKLDRFSREDCIFISLLIDDKKREIVMEKESFQRKYILKLLKNLDKKINGFILQDEKKESKKTELRKKNKRNPFVTYPISAMNLSDKIPRENEPG